MISVRKHWIFLSALALLSAPLPAFASWLGHWDPDSWEQQNDRPYIEHPSETQNTQWDNDPWSPKIWAQQRKGGAQEVIDGFYRADIIRKLYTEHGTAAVRVGPAFYTLGGEDQRRVASMIDDTYGITANKTYGMFTLYDWNNDRAIGTYTQYGLQMQ